MADAALPGTKLYRLDCRASTCRAELTFANEEADRDALRRLFLDPSTAVETGMVVTVPIRSVRADGTIEATIYLHREEAPPPTPAVLTHDADPRRAASSTIERA